MWRFGGVAAIVLIAVVSVGVQTAAAEDDEPSLVHWLIPEALTTKYDVYFGNVPKFNIFLHTPGLNILDEIEGMSDPDPYDVLPEFRFRMNYLIFSGYDLWRHGGFAHLGVIWSPQGLDREGFALKLIFGGGLYGYNSGALNNWYVNGRQLAFAAMPGWRFVRNGWIVSVFAGLDMQAHRVWPDDPGAGLKGGYMGFRTAIELWLNPTAQTMISADAAYSTVGSSYNARAAFGWEFFRLFYVGPELQGFMTANNYRQFRAGMHVTSFKTKMTAEWSLGFGAARDSDDRSSLYIRGGYLFKL